MNQETKNIVYLGNELAQSSYTLTLNEQRLLYILLSKVKPTEYLVPMTTREVELATLEEVQKYNVRKKVFGDTLDSITLNSISVAEFAEFTGLELRKAREDLLSVAERLFDREILIKHADGVGYTKFRWISSIRYDAGSDTVGLRWSVDILPYITELKERFTKLLLKDLLGLQSTYSWKLYTLLKSHKGENNYIKDVVISVEDLIWELKVPESCKEFKVLNSRILEKATKELAKKAMVGLTMEKVLRKGSKRVEGVRWKGAGGAKVVGVS